MFRPEGFVDGDRLQVAGATVRLRINPRARRVSLRMDRRAGEVLAIAPSKRLLAAAAAFAREREAWIGERLAEAPRPAPFAPGMRLTIFDEPVLLETGEGRTRWRAATFETPARITAMGEGEGFCRAVTRQIRKRALEVLTERTEAHCQALGVEAPPVAVMDARTRWGSCTLPPRASIRYSWRLALAPFAVADYVAAHECAHLLEANHGPGFWAHVRRLAGNPVPHRAWLREHGARLHAAGQA